MSSKYPPMNQSGLTAKDVRDILAAADRQGSAVLLGQVAAVFEYMNGGDAAGRRYFAHIAELPTHVGEQVSHVYEFSDGSQLTARLINVDEVYDFHIETELPVTYYENGKFSYMGFEGGM